MNRLLGVWYALLRNFHNQKRAADDTDQGTRETEYDDRQSMLPFVKENQRLESFVHQGKPEKHEDDATHQRKLVDWTRRLAYTTGALAIATFIVACFSGWQAREMHSGADQQHRDTLAALGKTDATIVAMESQAAIMQGQLNEMEIARRPWVTADIFITGEITLQEGSVTIPTLIALRNTGQTPATQTDITGEVFATFQPDMVAENKRICKSITGSFLHNITLAPSVFPGDKLQPLSYIFNLSKERIEEFRAHNPTMRGAIHPILLICIAYKEYGRPEIHHTSFGFRFMGFSIADLPMPATNVLKFNFPTVTIPPD
jgi:hypothetical protein